MARNHHSLSDRLWQWFYTAAYRILLIWWFIFRPAVQGVHIAVWCGDRILLVRNSYRRHYTLPCGGVKSEEDIRLAACRELFEEVRIEVDPDELGLEGNYLNRSEFKKDHFALFEIRFTSEPPLQVDNREVIWAGFMTPEEALHLNLFPSTERYIRESVDDNTG